MKMYSNNAFKLLFSNSARYYYNIGGRHSGKTFESIQIILYRLLVVPGSRACFMRKVYSSIKDSLYSDTIEIMKSIGIKFYAIKSPLEITLNNGSVIIFKGADLEDKLKGLSSIDIILMDEVNEFKQQDFETIDQSIRGKRQENSIYLCQNPVPKTPGKMHWFEKMFSVENEAGKAKIYYDEDLGSKVITMKSTYQQNKKCPEHVKKRLEGYKNTNPSLYKLWALGEYTEIEGVILKDWDVVDSVPSWADFIGYGLDFGFSADPAAMVAIWGHNQEIWVKGIIYSSGLTNRDLSAKMREAGVDVADKIIADSAEPKSIEDLYRDGFRGIKGAKKRANYKAEMANQLRGYQIHLVSGDIDLQREVSTWAWDKDKEGHDLPRPADGDDHYIDAMIMLMHESGQNPSILDVI